MIVNKIKVYVIHNKKGEYYPDNARSILSKWKKSLVGAKKFHTENNLMKTYRFVKNKYGEENTFIAEYELVLKNSMTFSLRERLKKIIKIKQKI